MRSYLAHTLVVGFALCGRVADAQADSSEAVPSSKKDQLACITTFEKAQHERLGMHLLEARELALSCAQPACGPAIAADCSQLYADTERALPSVVLSVHDDASNTDLTQVEVTANGKPFTTTIDGRPIPVNPGEYEFVVSTRNRAPVRRVVVVGAGDKYRAINIVLPAPSSSVAIRPSPRAAAQPTVDSPLQRVPVASWVLGGVGVVGLAGGGISRSIASGDYDYLKTSCGTQGCPEADVKALQRKYLVSDIAFGVGAAALGGSIVWYLFEIQSSEEVAVSVTPTPNGNGALATAIGRF